jgi:hypothetical protein
MGNAERGTVVGLCIYVGQYLNCCGDGGGRLRGGGRVGVLVGRCKPRRNTRIPSM